jgi:hypothetical protein
MQGFGILFGICMKWVFVVFILFPQCLWALEEPEYCASYLGDMEKACLRKRAEYFFGDKADYIEEKVDKISALLRESMLSRQYESLEPYLQFPFTFVVTDFRKAELRKDATGYTLEVNNMKEFRNFLIKINKRHPKVFLEFLPEIPYGKHYMNTKHAVLIDGNHKSFLNISKNFSLKIDSMFLQIF